jgi:murein DD-endopeptidase MepM/ murein hydrolase activator NlpD
MKIFRLVVFSLSLLIQPSFASESLWAVSTKPREVLQGGVVEISLRAPDSAQVKGLLRQQEIPFFPEEGGNFAGLLGVDLEEKPGTLRVVLRGKDKGGAPREQVLTLRVKKKDFPSEQVSVPAAFDRLDEGTLKRIEREQARFTQLLTISTPHRFWQRPFLPPVPVEITSPFGLRRIVNGAARSPHGGVDLKASLGTEVVASNHGQVVLRDEFFFSGKSIVLDHGGGLYTMYFHLADFRAEERSRVRKGEVIGWSGMTGRVSGPHLHWGMRLNGARVDPLALLEAGDDRR